MKQPLIQVQQKEYYVQVNERGLPITGEIKPVDVIVREIPRTGFAITYLSAIVQMIDSIGNRKMRVVRYILSKMDSNNYLLETEAQIAEHSNTSRQTVHETLMLLEKAGIVARKPGVVMLSPKLIHKGNVQKERYLLTKFKELQNQ